MSVNPPPVSDGASITAASLPDAATPGATPPDATTQAAVAPDAATPGPVTSDAARSGDAGSEPAPALDPNIVTMVGQVRDANLSATIAKLSGFNSRNTCSDDTTGSSAIGGARDWIQAQLAAIPGLTVKQDPFTYGGCAGKSVTRENVVAWKPGAGHPDRLVLIGGHYDSRTLNVTDGTSPAPGANDSGSQTALVLEVARVMAGQTFDATLVFVAFAGEEQGLVGSRSLAVGYRSYFSANASIEAVFNNDIVGGDNTVNDATSLQKFRLYAPGTPRELTSADGTTDDTSPARGLMRHIASWGAAYVPSMSIVPELREDRLGRGGDHEAFLDQGYPGVRFIETIESPNAGTVASHEHSPNDLATYLTPAYTARIAQVVIASAASLARAPTPPQSMAAAGSAATPITLSWSPPISGSAVDHYVLAGRASTENLYRTRIAVPENVTSRTVSVADLGLSGAPSFFVSVAAVDAQGHESLFAYPEYRCDTSGCLVQTGSLNVTARN
jgi:acetylornithine deacetylase/succinyl-diaminopimelate desuccinylase-like protein